MDTIDYSALLVQHQKTIAYFYDAVTHEVLYMTPSAMQMHGFGTAADYCGRKCYEMLRNRSEECPGCPLPNLKPGKPYMWESYEASLNTWISIEDHLVEAQGRLLHVGVLRNLSDDQNRLKRVTRQLAQEETLVRCIESLAYGDDINAAMQQLIQILGEFYKADRTCVLEVDEKAAVYNGTVVWCAPGIIPRGEELKNLPQDKAEEWLRYFQCDGRYRLCTLDAAAPGGKVHEFLTRYKLYSLAVVPLHVGQKITGYLAVENPTMAEGDWMLLQSAASFVGEELEKRRLRDRLEYVSYTDVLTGLRNRNRYENTLERLEQQHPASVGVVFVDINGLKAANDKHGHKYGDEMIVRAATILSDHIPAQGYRIGGDEFISLWENVSSDEFADSVQRMRAAYEADPLCDVSIGGVWADGDYRLNELVSIADERMYKEKKHYYQRLIDSGTSARAGLAGELMQDINEDTLVVYFQPQIEIATGRISGAEALVRKREQNGSLLAPDAFLPMYEAEGLMHYVDLFVLKQVCSALRHWRQQGWVLHASVNFSRATLTETGIVAAMTEICKQAGVPPAAIKLELNENICAQETQHQKELVVEIAAAGFQLSLDGFGVDYASLAMLRDWAFSEVKLDRRLLADAMTDARSSTVVRGSIGMCSELGNTATLAEGVETRAQLDWLLENKCQYAQGYYFSYPLPLRAFEQFYTAHLAPNGAAYIK